MAIVRRLILSEDIVDEALVPVVHSGFRCRDLGVVVDRVCVPLGDYELDHVFFCDWSLFVMFSVLTVDEVHVGHCVEVIETIWDNSFEYCVWARCDDCGCDFVRESRSCNE